MDFNNYSTGYLYNYDPVIANDVMFEALYKETLQSINSSNEKSSFQVVASTSFFYVVYAPNSLFGSVISG